MAPIAIEPLTTLADTPAPKAPPAVVRRIKVSGGTKRKMIQQFRPFGCGMVICLCIH